jgi:hypothetical protein
MSGRNHSVLLYRRGGAGDGRHLPGQHSLKYNMLVQGRDASIRPRSNFLNKGCEVNIVYVNVLHSSQGRERLSNLKKAVQFRD